MKNRQSPKAGVLALISMPAPDALLPTRLNCLRQYIEQGYSYSGEASESTSGLRIEQSFDRLLFD